MKKLIPLISVIILLGCSKPQAPKFEIHRGLNISHWLSQTGKRGLERERYIQEIDFKTIAEAGFDHVRIPFEEEQLWDEDGKRHEEAFALLHQGIKWAFKYNLKVIADLHIVRSHHFVGDNQRLFNDPLEEKKFYGFWKQLSKELSQYPNDKLAYELLNEAVAENANDWNKLVANGIAKVRESEPNRVIVIGSNRWQQVYTFPQLQVPVNDKNLILSFHFYDPFMITHYRTSWNGAMGKYDGPLNYPGHPVDTADLNNYDATIHDAVLDLNHDFTRESMEQDILIAVRVADSLGLPLYCGEFGCYPTVNMEIRKTLYADWISIFKEHGIAWCHWNYKNDFPAFDAETLEPIREITDILLNKDFE